MLCREESGPHLGNKARYLVPLSVAKAMESKLVAIVEGLHYEALA
jgi:hypothetical protein